MSDYPLPSPRFTARKVALAAGLALLGAACGAVVGHFTRGLDLSWPDELAGFVALVCVAMGVASAVAVALRPPAVKSACAWLQVATLLLAAALLLLLMAAPSTWPPVLVFAAVCVLLAVQAGANLLLWRISDELMRRVIVETGALTFWALQAALFAYAAAGRLGLVETVSGWGLISLLMIGYLVASTVVAIRRGLANA